MASLESTRTAGAPGKPAGTRTGESSLAIVIALSSLLAIGAFMLLAPIIRAALPITDLPDPFIDHHQDAETLLFVLSYLVLLPGGIWAGGRLADRVEAGPNAAALPGVVAVLAVLLALVLLAARVSSAVVLSLGAAVWLAFALLILSRAARLDKPALDRVRIPAGPTWVLALLLVVASALAFSAVSSISKPVLVAGTLAGIVLFLARERLSLPDLPRAIRLLADLAVVALLLLAIPNLAIFAPGAGAGEALQAGFIQFHQNFFLGPANQVMAGEPMLVDTLSQYGVGSILFLVGLFEVIPIGNGTLGLIEGVLSALLFIGAWAVMRVAGVSRLLAAGAMFVAVVTLVYGLQYPIGGLLQHGAFRFGLPIGVVLGAVLEVRRPTAARPARILQMVTIAVASIWALEAFAYTVLTAFAVAAMLAWLRPPGERRLLVVHYAGWAAAACLGAHVLFAGVTLGTTGELPDWGWYANTLREFLFGGIGDLTYDFSPWSPGLAVGAVYLVSAIALVQFMRRRPDLARAEATAMVAIAGMTAFGVALLSYIVNRSSDHIVPYVCLPAITVGTLWLSLLDRPTLAIPASGRRMGWTLGLAVSVLLVAVAASSLGTRFHQSALAYARPGGASLSIALDRLWDPAPLRPGAGEGEVLLDRWMPGEERSSVIASADLGLEILIRAGRGSAVPLGDPWEDSFVPDQHLDALGAYVDGLRPGDRLLIDGPAREVFEDYRADPTLDPFATATDGGAVTAPSGLASLQEWTLKEIGLRFDIHTLARSPSGLEVVELVPRDDG